jgi:hypothetical protein
MLDRRYLRGAKDMREAVARILEECGRPLDADDVRDLDPEAVRATLANDPAWTRRMLQEDVEHQRAGWRERTAKHQAKKKSRGAVKSACTPARPGA